VANPALKIVMPYKRAVAFAALADEHQRQLVRARSMRSDLNRIAKVQASWGDELDRLGVSHAQLRWLAGAVTLGVFADQERRYRALHALLLRGGTWKEFHAMAADFAKLGVAAVAEANRRAEARRTRSGPYAPSRAVAP
jgi:hypothetical protein